MALIKCAECNNQVSSTAATCPHCGAPVASKTEHAATGSTVTTVQETGKRLKVHIMLSLAIFFIGIISAAVSFSAAQNNAGEIEASPYPGLMIFVGAIWYVITRFRIWWHHK